ncbi:MAG TPA: 2Fe-2S iron-sulfur cluster-binding protein, partial [Steroidobacteraceae bacterium]|nr:2Fe-2S iron-sulfur cluster-binding protein [Steroidobacteraceae bacterium]
MWGPARIAQGLLTDSQKPIVFRFDGRRMRGLAGDTLASALLANGQRIVGRSLKYHRPRGIVTGGSEEPCALVEVLGTQGREPNRLATTLELREGLETESQNRWPSLRFDALAVNNLFARFLPAGFYYKTFMAPGQGWERLYEPLLRRAAGLGRLQGNPHAAHAPAETVHDHVDVLIVGAGTAGLAAAQRLGGRGLRVMLVEEDCVLGGGSLLDERWSAWRELLSTALSAMGQVRCLTRTAVIGAYGQGVYGALETLSHTESIRLGGLRERLRIIRARATILATGAIERLIAFPGNDIPGVMLAGAAHKFLRRYGVAAGRRPVFFVNSDEAYEAAYAYAAAGIKCSAVVDVRSSGPAAERARALGIEVVAGATVEAVHGRGAVRAVRIAHRDGRPRRKLEADCLLISGGYSPSASLASQLGAALQWREEIASFAPVLAPAVGHVAGAARGVFGLAAAARDGELAARAVGALLGHELANSGTESSLPPDPAHALISVLWEVPGRGKAFVDLQNDVTCADVRLAVREGYEHVEHMKRYTTHGMATDQGRIAGLLGSAILAQARGLSVAEVGQAKPRPFVQPIPFAALAGGEVGEHFKLKRRLPLHDWHESCGATFANIGLWLRPLVYSQQAGWEAVLREARAVRTAVGITDLSTLGKIDVQGPDAAKFLDFVYANTFSTLRVGGARYGIMLREDGMLLDDGTTSRLGAEHFLITTTTANSSVVLEHLEFHLQAVCPQFEVLLTEVGDQWAQFAVAGPHSRDVVASVVTGLDLTNRAFPFMSAAAAQIAAINGRVFRISFSGELAYELAVPAQYARNAWGALLEAGTRFGIVPYGLDALNTLRIEKGHVTAAELNGNTSADDLGMHRLLKKHGDFVGRALSQRPGLSAPDRL